MSAFSPKQSQLPQRTSSNTTSHNAPARSINHHENQAVLRTLQVGHQPGEAAATSEAGAAARHPGFTYNFASIPVFHTPVRGIQRKLTVNSPGDAYEQEADRVSEQVMRMPDAAAIDKRSFVGSTAAVSSSVVGDGASLQRKCACAGSCDQCKKKDKEHHEHEHAKIQLKTVGPGSMGGMEAPPIIHEVLRSPGQPLDTATRAFMEPRFGHDFTGVRVHTDSAAERSAQVVQARAYTVGQDIVFGAGEYAAHSLAGRSLLAHELTHTIQQGVISRLLQRDSKPGAEDEPCQRGQMRMGKGMPCFPVTLPGRDCPLGQAKFAGQCVPLDDRPSLFDTKLHLDPKFMPPEQSPPGALHLDPTLARPSPFTQGSGSPGTGGTGAAPGCKYSVNYVKNREVDCEKVEREAGMPAKGALCGKRVIYDIVSVSVSPGTCPLAGLKVSERLTSNWDTHSCRPRGFQWPQPNPCTIGPGGKLTGCTDTLTMCGLTSDLKFGGCEEKLTQEMLVDGKPVETHTITFELDVQQGQCTSTTITRT